LVAYYNLEKQKNNIEVLRENIIYFNQEKIGIKTAFVRSKSAIQSAIIPEMKSKSDTTQLQENGFDVKLFANRARGSGTLVFCLHSYNSPEEISAVMHCISHFFKNFNFCNVLLV
jgi:8-amino-7-oxononanoate synthase